MMEACKQKLIERINAHPVSDVAEDTWYFQRFTVDGPEVDLLAWLNGQDVTYRVFFSSADNSIQLAGTGCAAAWGELPQVPGLYESGMPCFYTMPFAEIDDSPEQKWASFSKPNAFIPLIDCSADGELSANLVCPPGSDLTACRNTLIGTIEGVMAPKPVETAVAPWVRREDNPEFGQWEQSVENILCRIGNDELKKVVIARETSFTFDAALADLSVFRRLIEQAPDSNHFLFSIGSSTTFFGATPELLFKRDGHEIFSHAVAGTRGRGCTAEDDAVLAEELINSAKECNEHRLVADMLEDRLRPLCTEVLRTPVTIMKLPRLQHLYCDVSGTLRERYSDLAIVEALHPTPAVGGVPSEAALKLIDELEPFSRGCYAAPVGIVQGDCSRFLVAIRSALVVGKHLYTYAGAGIVEGSEALAEWNEVESKIASVRGVFPE